jgi:hypothetical protein
MRWPSHSYRRVAAGNPARAVGNRNRPVAAVVEVGS